MKQFNWRDQQAGICDRCGYEKPVVLVLCKGKTAGLLRFGEWCKDCCAAAGDDALPLYGIKDASIHPDHRR